MAEVVNTRGQLADSIAKSAEENAEFKKALLADPRKLMTEELGVDIPAATKIEVVQEKSDTFYIVLPYKAQEGEELGDSDLEQVAGGSLNKVNKASCRTVTVVNLSL